MRRGAFRLALALGVSDPDAMVNEMPLPLFNEWMEYFRLEPGTANTNNQLAMIGSMMAGQKPSKYFEAFGGVRIHRQWSDQEIVDWIKNTYGNGNQKNH